jgi:apolipoprotein D and lipocalin family protein
MLKPLALLLTLALAGCVDPPSGVEPVTGFKLDSYLGEWYEIARLDHRFERGLEQVTATYSLHEEGGVRVLNRGRSTEDGEWREAEGRAYFVAGEDVGHLKVSFLGPFFSGYVIFELDKEDYQHAFVSGPNRDHLWLLSRDPTVTPALLDRFVRRADELGFDTSSLILVKQR